MDFKGLVKAALIEIEDAKRNTIAEKFDFDFDVSPNFEIFKFSKELTNGLQFFIKDSECSVYHSLFRVSKVVQSKNERIILAIPGSPLYPLFRPSKLPVNSEISMGPFGIYGQRNQLLQRCIGMLVKDFDGNVTLTNSYKFNSKNAKSVLQLGLSVIDNYELTEAARLDVFFCNYFGIGMNDKGEIIILNTKEYNPIVDWVNVFKSLGCSDAAVVYAPESEYFFRSCKGLFDIKTYSGYITFVKNKDDIQEFILEEMGAGELYKYYLLSRR